MEVVSQVDTPLSKNAKRGAGEATGPDAGSTQQVADMTGRPKRSVARDMKRGKELGSKT